MQIQVFLTSKSSKPVYERIIEVDDSLRFDYSCIVRSMKLLYGLECIIQFTVV